MSISETPKARLSLRDLSPYPSIYIDAETRAATVREILENGAIPSYDGKPLVTKTDLFYIPNECFSKKNVPVKNNAVLKEKDIKIFSLLREALGDMAFEIENIPDTLKMLSEVLIVAKEYMSDYLGLDIPPDLKKLDKFENINDVLIFLKKTTGLKQSEGLGRSHYYCAIVQIMRAELEYRKGDFKELEGNAAWLEEELFKDDLHFIKTGKVDDSWDEILIISEDIDVAASKARFSARGKTHQRALTKMIAKEHFDSKDAINDGIGIRLEIPDNVNEKELILFLSTYFTEKNSATHLECKDNNFCNTDRENISKFKSLLHNAGVILKPQDNKVSNPKYQAIDLKGYLKVTKDNIKPFEIQIVRLGNQNEDGMARHEIYEPLQKMIVVTRLMGSFSEKYLNLLVNEAAIKTKFSKEKIKKYYLERELVEVKSCGRSRKIKSFAAKTTISRIKQGGLIPDRITLVKTR